MKQEQPSNTPQKEAPSSVAPYNDVVEETASIGNTTNKEESKKNHQDSSVVNKTTKKGEAELSQKSNNTTQHQQAAADIKSQDEQASKGAQPLQNNASETFIKTSAGSNALVAVNTTSTSATKEATAEKPTSGAQAKNSKSASLTQIAPTKQTSATASVQNQGAKPQKDNNKLEKQSVSETVAMQKASQQGAMTPGAAGISNTSSKQAETTGKTTYAKKKKEPAANSASIKDSTTSAAVAANSIITKQQQQATAQTPPVPKDSAASSGPPIVKKQTSQSAKATPKPSAVQARLAAQQLEKASKQNSNKDKGDNSSSTAQAQQVPKVLDKWPHLKSAADWNREEKEREIRENLAKMAGITFSAPSSSTKQAQVSVKGFKGGKQSYSQQLELEKQYQQQNFATLTSFDQNKEIRVGTRYQVTVSRDDYPGSTVAPQKESRENINPEEQDLKEDKDIQIPMKRVIAPNAAVKLLQPEDQEQVSPSKRMKRPALPRIVSHGEYGEDSAELKEYLELCDFIMREASSNLNGMLLRGSSQYQEKAMNILTQHNFNFDMAKFSILYPTVLLIPQQRQKFLKAISEDETLLSKIVREAIMDLKGCKQDEIDEIHNELRQALNQRIKPEELKVFQRKFQKMQIKFPDDVEQKLLDAEEFSREVRKKLNSSLSLEKRQSLEQLEQMQIVAKAQCLETPELIKLEAQLANAHDWLNKVKEIKDQEIALRDLERLLKTGKSLPVKFGEPYSQISERLTMATDLQKSIQGSFLSKKTRQTNVQSSFTKDSTLTGFRNRNSSSVTTKSNHGMYQEKLNKDLQNKGLELKVKFKDLDDLSELIARVENWKYHTGNFLNNQTIRQQMRKRLKFKNYLNEARLLKLGMPQVEQLQQRYDYIEWRVQVNSFWRKALRDNPELLGNDNELAVEIDESENAQDEAVDEEINANDSGAKSQDSDTPGKKYKDSEHCQGKREEEQENGQLQHDSSSIKLQGMTFILLKDTKEMYFAQKSSRKKVELQAMRQLIEDLIEKGFYQKKQLTQEADLIEEVEKSPNAKQMEKSKQSQQDEHMKIDVPEEVEAKSPHQDDIDVEMQDEEEQKEVPMISLNKETGDLQIEEASFAIHEKPYTVRLLLQTYTKSKDFIEKVTEVIDELTKMQQSTNSIGLMLACQNDPGVELISIEKIHKIWTKSSSLLVNIPQIADLFSQIERVADQDKKIKDLIPTDVEKIKLSFAEVLLCCRTGVRIDSFANYYDIVQPLQFWCHRTRYLVKEYYKTIELKHNQLSLIDSSLTGKPFEKRNPFRKQISSGNKTDIQDSQSSNKLGKKKANDYEQIVKLINEATSQQKNSDQKQQQKLIQQTKEYQHLALLKEKIDSISTEIKSLTSSIGKEKGDLNEQAQLLAKIDGLLTIGLPLDPELHEYTNKTLKLAKWKLRLAKLKRSKTVTLKQLESLLKESKNHVVQDDKECKIQAVLAEKQYQLCKLWLQKFEQIEDFNDLQAVQALIDQATKQLDFVLEEFTQLKEEHYESLKMIKEGYDQLFNENSRTLKPSNDAQEDSSTNKKQATHEILKNLIDLKQQMLQEEEEQNAANKAAAAISNNISANNNTAVEVQQESQQDRPQQAQEQKCQNDATILTTTSVAQDYHQQQQNNMFELKGNDIELLTQMSGLVEVWRTISQRALTSAIYTQGDEEVEQEFKFMITLNKNHAQEKDNISNQQYSQEETEKALCSICKKVAYKQKEQLQQQSNNEIRSGEIQEENNKNSSISCIKCSRVFHQECILLRQISYEYDFMTNFCCFACQLRQKIDLNIVTDGPPKDRFQLQLESQELFLRRRQRLSIEQLQTIIEAGDNLLPTLYLPELDQLQNELQRAQKVLDNINLVSSRPMGVSESHLTALIFQSETLIVDLNKPLWQAVLHTQQLRRLAAVQKSSD